MLHAFVGFVADFPGRAVGNELAGRELAEFIYDALTSAGLNTSKSEDNGWAWVLFTRDSNLVAQSTIGIVDDMQAIPPRQWLITNDCPLPFLKRLFNRKGAQAQQQLLLRRICVAIHEAMHRDSRFSSVLWYRADTFDKQGDVPSTHPDAA